MRLRRCRHGSVLVLLLSFARRDAVAQDPQDPQVAAARRALLEQAQDANNAGDHARALSLAEQAGRLQMSPSLRLFLARQLDALGRLGVAFGMADLCVREVERDSALLNRGAILESCTQLRTQLRSRLGYVILRPTAEYQGLRVLVNGEAVSSQLLGIPYVVTPGRVTVVASAPNHEDQQALVEVSAGRTVELPLTLQAHATNSGVPSGPVVGSATQTIAPVGGPAPWVLLGAGGVSLAVGLVFFGLREDALSGCTWRTNSIVCNSNFRSGPGYADSAYTHHGVFLSGVIAGGTLLTAGGVWLVLRAVMRPQLATTRARMEPTAGGLAWHF